MEELETQIDQIIVEQKKKLTKKYNKLIKEYDKLKSTDSKKRYRNKIQNNIKQIDNVEDYIE